MAPLPDTLPTPRIRIVRNALVLPADDTPQSAHGVYDRAGGFAPLSQTRMSRDRISGVPDWAKATDHLPGTHLYAGLGRRHFGHFLIETMARIWALERSDRKVDGVVAPELPGSNLQWALLRHLRPVSDRLCDGLPVLAIVEPTRVERLMLPTQGFGHGPWITGTPEFRSYIKARFADVRPNGPERLYLTRNRLTAESKQVDQEDAIEAMMADAGYEIFAPEAHSFEDQCARLKAARFVVGADGSAFHLAPFLLQPGARAAIYLRRNRPEMLTLLGAQMQAFAGIKPALIDPLVQPYSQVAPSPLDLARLKVGLSDHGML
ncbi:glycosyltransferase family 61 protein [uncultured Tateyamaria sp.]|uniref:glycosyltransferase family 61 protein n=1 Tax=uncultured Tateyamaria sp. TaxID=455651 RepID=UPI00260CA798|nr:glycosyltransferase family 61 protein [uncultured Tateyamaria sp.]